MLNKGWVFQQSGGDRWYQSVVPGCVHTDLLYNGLISDPFAKNNEKNLQWINDKNWNYQLFFKVNKEILIKENKTISFEGIDTYADIFLNGKKILSPNNMFHPWEKEVSDILKSGINELGVYLRSPIKEVLADMDQLTYQLPADNDQAGKTSPFTRKAPYHYGWDWGPCLVTSGIWKDVKLHGWDSCFINHCSILNDEVESTKAKLLIELDVVSKLKQNCKLCINEPKSGISLELQIQLKKGRNRIIEPIVVKDPMLWWPWGHGDQPLYNFEIKLKSEKESIQFSKRTGIRKVLIERQKDSDGQSFEVHVNGKPIFSKGANWIPADSFTTRLKKKNYANLLDSVRDVNMNMLRVWGGGIYEPDVFYELCDEMGIMVWQDFMFACSMYPAHQEFLNSVKIEAEYQVNRLKSHPSIVLWCGNNEIAIAWHSWGWKEKLPSSVWNDYAKIFHKVLPGVCKNLDPGRFYWPSSPGYTTKLPENNQIYGSGDNHYWGVWHGGDGFDAFEKNNGRFLSEYGMQSFPEISTITKFAEEKDLDINSEVMLSRQKASLGTANLVKYIEDYLTMKSDFQSMVIASQIIQALAIKTAVEIHRMSMPFCMGTLYWQLNDCWPAISWSSVDYYGNWKALHYYAKRFFKPIIIVISEKKGRVLFNVVNDQHQQVESNIDIQISTFKGSMLMRKSINYLVPNFSSNEVFSFEKNKYLNGQKNSNIFINAKIIKDKNVMSSNNYFFVNPIDFNLPFPKLKHKVQTLNKIISIEINASTFIYQLYIECNNSEGVFSDNYFDLLAGDTVTIFFTPIEVNNDLSYDFSFKSAFEIIKR